MSNLNQALVWGQGLWQNANEFFSYILGSKVVQTIFESANGAYLTGEEHARKFIIQGLDLSSIVRKDGWKILLESATDEDLRKLQALLKSASKKDD